MNQLDVYCRRPRHWALSSPVIPTRRVDERYSKLCETEFEWTRSVFKCVTINVMMGMLEVNQLEYRSRLCEGELKRSGFDVELCFLDASGARLLAGTEWSGH